MCFIMHFLLFIFLSIFSNQVFSVDRLPGNEIKQEILSDDLSEPYLSSDLSKAVEDIQKSLFEGNQEKAEEVIRDIDIKSRANLFSRLMLLGHKRTLYKKIEEIMRRLSLPGEPNYVFKVSGKPIPNAQISPTEKPPCMTIFLGLLALTSNEDELASVIAHEMTHGHMEYLKASIDNTQVNEMLNTIHGYEGLEPDQREEIRADLGVVDRLIKAGYNPWAYYNLLKKMNTLYSQLLEPKILGAINKVLFPRSFEYMSTHPAFEIRSSAVKSYILFKSLREDISEQIKDHKPFGVSVGLLRKKAQIINVFVANVWMERLIISYLALSLFFGLDFISEVELPVPDAVKDSANTLFSYFSSIIELLIPDALVEFVSTVGSHFRNIPRELGNFIATYFLLLEIIILDHIIVNNIIVGGRSPMTKLKRLKKTWKKHNRIVHRFHQKKIMEEFFNPNHSLRILNRNINYLKNIDFICRHSQWLCFLRYRNGLAYTKYRALKNTRRLLEDTSPELLNDPDFLSLALKKLDELPSFALTDKHLRKTIENLFVIPDIQNIFEYQSSEMSSDLQRKLAILKVSENITAKSSSEERLLTIKYLAENGFFTEARKLLNTGVNHLHGIVDYVFSSKAQPHYADDLTFLLNQLKSRGTLRAPTHRKRLFLDRQLLFINKQKGNVHLR